MSDLMSSLRTALGITDDNADEATILAALNEALAEQTEPPVQNKVEPASPRELVKAAELAGARLVDNGVWDELQNRVKTGEDAKRKLRDLERDTLLNDAVADGRIHPGSKQSWANMYDADARTTTEAIAALRRNYVPVAELGYDNGLDDNGLGEYADIFPKGA